MKITADTNVLVRALVQDEPDQARAASALLAQAELVAVPLPVLCELVWVLRRVYRFSASDCIGAIEALLASASVRTDRPAVRAGLQLLAAASLGATNWRPLTRRQRGFWLQPVSRCVFFLERIRPDSSSAARLGLHAVHVKLLARP